MYAHPNFKTKKALKEAVAQSQDGAHSSRVTVFSPGPFPCDQNGTEYLEGPHSPAPHTWYAQATVVDGVIVKVK